jgi:hypothetical protein
VLSPELAATETITRLDRAEHRERRRRRTVERFRVFEHSNSGEPEHTPTREHAAHEAAGLEEVDMQRRNRMLDGRAKTTSRRTRSRPAGDSTVR